MRISVLETDPGYTPYHSEIAVYFNGRLLDNCLTADDVTGEAWVETYAESGRVIVDANGDSVLRRIVGKVEIRRIQ